MQVREYPNEAIVEIQSRDLAAIIVTYYYHVMSIKKFNSELMESSNLLTIR